MTMRWPWRVAGTLLLLLAMASGVSGQSKEKEPKEPRRPKLPEGQDTNSAVAYYDYGFAEMKRRPARAADAFYWASRLEPSWAEPLFGRFVALVMMRPLYDLRLFFGRREDLLRVPALRSIDSLGYAALLRNPYVNRRLGGLALADWISLETGGTYRLQDLTQYDERFNAWAAYSRGDYAEATKLYRKAIARDSNFVDLLVEQSQNFFAQQQLDSARAMMRQALRTIRRIEEDSLYVGWMPNAFAEYSIGFLFSLDQQWDSARAGYERALLDDIQFHPAHRELGRMRLIARDTAGAIAEYSEAVALAPDYGPYLYQLGVLLMTTGKTDSASRVLKRSIAAEPYYSMPYYALGLIHEHSGYPEEAAEYYRGFILRAPRTLAPTIDAARRRLASLAPK